MIIDILEFTSIALAGLITFFLMYALPAIQKGEFTLRFWIKDNHLRLIWSVAFILITSILIHVDTDSTAIFKFLGIDFEASAGPALWGAIVGSIVTRTDKNIAKINNKNLLR